jgi:succinate dehydrogenase hydrophobic anchor subunit
LSLEISTPKPDKKEGIMVILTALAWFFGVATAVVLVLCVLAVLAFKSFLELSAEDMEYINRDGSLREES